MAVHERCHNTHLVVMSVAVPREKLWRCLTNSALLRQWYSQPPYKVIQADLDVRPGGTQVIAVVGIDGKPISTTDVFLEVIEGTKLVYTDAFDKAWVPNSKVTKVTEIQLESVPKGTLFSLSVAYWNNTDFERLDTNFDEGWRLAAGRIEALCRTF